MAVSGIPSKAKKRFSPGRLRRIKRVYDVDPDLLPPQVKTLYESHFGGGEAPSLETIKVKVGSFTTPGSAGNQVITGLGFQPEAIVAFGSGTTSEDTVTPHFVLMQGFSDGINDRCMIDVSRDSLGAADVYREQNDQSLIIQYDIGGTNARKGQATLSSFDPDGFTLNWSSVSEGEEIYYIAYGGDISAEVGDFNTKTTTGVQNIPTGIDTANITLLMGSVYTTDQLNTTRGYMAYSYGVGTDSNQGHTAVRSNDFTSISNNAKRQRTDSILSVYTAVGTITTQGSFEGHTSSGFDIDWTIKDTAAWHIFYLTIKGGQWQVGSGSTPVSTGSQAYPTSFRPRGLGVFSKCAAPSTGIDDNAEFSFGVSDGTNSRCSSSRDNDNLSTTVADRISESDEVLSAFNSSSTIEEEGNVDSFNATDFTLNYGLAGAIEREFIWWICGDV